MLGSQALPPTLPFRLPPNEKMDSDKQFTQHAIRFAFLGCGRQVNGLLEASKTEIGCFCRVMWLLRQADGHITIDAAFMTAVLGPPIITSQRNHLRFGGIGGQRT
jgi:hypothetical protein